MTMALLSDEVLRLGK